MQTTQSNPEMQHVNYESDFRVVFSFPEDKVPDYPWEIELSTPQTPAYNAFVASFDGKEYHNCSMQSDTKLLIAVDNHKLQPGILSYKFKIKAPDSAFPDGVMNVTTPGQLGIELWTGPSDEFEHEGVNVIVLPLEGDKGEPGEPGAPGEPGRSAYELFKEYNPGSELTEEQYAEAPVVEAARAAALADNPPKIVELEGVQYWAFWNEETKQYVLSENRADVGDAVLFSPQVLTPQQQEQVQKNIAPGGYLRTLLEKLGAVRDDDTGLWSLYADDGGLTDITDDEILTIYSLYNGTKEMDMSEKLSQTNIRTCFPIQSTWTYINLLRCFQNSKYIKVIKINCYVSNLIQSFYGCQSLSLINGVINLNYISKSDYATSSFNGCSSLKTVNIKNVKVSLSFKDSPLINYNSIKFMVDNSANTSAITITVHPTTYSYLTGTAEPTEQVGGTTEEWQSLVTIAQEKQISFVNA